MPDKDRRETFEELGAYIRAQRRQAELSVRKLADLANVSNPYLSQIERGLHEPSARVVRAIAAALNLSAETLLVHLDPEQGEPSPPTVEEAINADSRLSADQRAALLSVYRSFIEDQG